MALTKKQKLFVDEYLIDLNATQAAIRAGYSPDTAKEIGCENLTKPNIRAHIDRAMAERSKRTGVNADRVVIELAKIAFINAMDVIDTKTATVKADALPEDTAAIQSVKVKTSSSENSEMVEREIKMADKIKALELLGKHLGMFKDRVELSGSLESEKTKMDDIIQQLRGGG
nr:terminase small subunit [Hungatella effluvii]